MKHNSSIQEQRDSEPRFGAIAGLGYLGVRTDRPDEWTSFACELLGMQRVDAGGGTVAFRMDDRKQRLIVSDEIGDSLAFVGWEVTSRNDLDEIGSRLANAGIDVDWGRQSLADQRCVEALLICHDPAGNRLELFCDPMICDTPFVSGRPISGFKTGPLGMGHAVLHVPEVEPMLAFYRDLLGFHVSDYAINPYPLYFFHVNGRHHSFAIIGSRQHGFHHFMLEYNSLDDVGQGYDLARLEEDRIAYTLGRHTNDFMTSFYARTPSGFFVENGWGGRVIDPDTWQMEEMKDGPSLWGHDRLNLPSDQRKQMLELRLAAAAKGLQAPPVSECPWLFEVLSK